MIYVMVDNTRNNSAQRVTSKDYLEKLRQRRLSRQRTSPLPAQKQAKQTQIQDKPATPNLKNIEQKSSKPQQPSPNPSSQANTQFQQSTQPVEQESYQENLLPEDFELPKSRVLPGVRKPLPERTVLEWYAMSRPFKKRNKKFFTTVLVIALLISLILFFAGQILPVAVVISVVFLIYVLSVIPPQKIKLKITTYGIRIEKGIYYWSEMGRFWYTKKYGQNVLNIEVARFPGRLTLLTGDISKETITQIISEVLIQEKPEKTFFEKTADWLNEKISLDID